MRNLGFRITMTAALLCSSLAADWKPAAGPLMTRWAKEVTPENVHPEYPRPQLVREEWLNLNGLWDYAVRPRTAARPNPFDGQILVPFPVESALSGVMRRVSPKERLWYQREFSVPAAWSGRRVLLHFGAVDWEAGVWINGREVGTHQGGYDPFTFDITDALNDRGPQELLVAVWDPTDEGYQPRGKQVREPEGIWYTPTSGIWQTVWLEPVPKAHIAGLRVQTDIDAQRLLLTVEGRHADGSHAIEATVLEEGELVATASGPVDQPLEVRIGDARLWSPDSPFLYGLQVRLLRDGQVIDQVESYFGMREVSIGTDARGITRILLNNEPMLMFGPLDQGFWPDGLYTAPTDEALRYDIEVTKKLGFNMARKHVKVEPARWYYWCDRLGLLVWQDMPSGDQYAPRGGGEIERSEESAEQFERELRAMIDARDNHPSIVMWVIFNEGWGQYHTVRLADWIKRYDPTRLVNAASGWNDMKVGDVYDIHRYPGPDAPEPEPERAAVLGEFGGLGLPVAGHLWQQKENWGYRTYESPDELAGAYRDLLNHLRPLIESPGLSAAVYTQTTDVETEVNGLMTYDRAVIKMEPEATAATNRSLSP